MIGKVEVWLHVYSPLLFSPSLLSFPHGPTETIYLLDFTVWVAFSIKKNKNKKDLRFMCQNQQSTSLMRFRSKVTFEPVTKEVTG